MKYAVQHLQCNKVGATALLISLHLKQKMGIGWYCFMVDWLSSDGRLMQHEVTAILYPLKSGTEALDFQCNAY